MKSENHLMDFKHAIKGSEVFVGGLAGTVTESKIHEVFANCGEIMEIRMMKDQKGKSKGFCFVRFTVKEAADKAIKEKSNILLEGKKIGVLPSSNQDSLFLGNLRKDWTADEFDAMVHQVFHDVASVDLALSSSIGTILSQKQQNRGFAFVKFSSHAAAARAYRIASNSDFLLGGNWHPVVQWVRAESIIHPEELAKTRIAFVRSLPTDADEDYVKRLFEPLGKLEKVVVSRKGNSTAGFVHFVERLDLEKAIKEMNEKMVQGPKGGINFKLQVEIARPMDKKGKRARDEFGSKSLNMNLSVSKLRDGLMCSSPNHLTSKAPKLKHLIEELESTDPYEAAVVSLSATVKERLLRIMRLGIGTRFDIDIQCLTSLNELTESAAISVLDQFLLSGAEKQNKGAYFAGLISKHVVGKMRLNQSTLHLSTSGEVAPLMLPRLSERVHLPVIGSDDPSVCTTAGRLVDKMRLNQSTRPGEIASMTSALPKLSNRLHLPAVGSDDPFVGTSGSDDSDRASQVLFHYPSSVRALQVQSSHPSLVRSSQVISPHSSSARVVQELPPYSTMHRAALSPYLSSRASRIPSPYSSSVRASPVQSPYSPGSDLPLYPLTHLHQEKEMSPGPLLKAPIYSARYGELKFDPYVPAIHNRRSAPRFDPFTGKSYKFDPFTGERLHPESPPTYFGDRYS